MILSRFFQFQASGRRRQSGQANSRKARVRPGAQAWIHYPQFARADFRPFSWIPMALLSTSFTGCLLMQPAPSEPPGAENPASGNPEEIKEGSPTDQISYPRIVASSRPESMNRQMFSPGESSSVVLNDGSRVTGTTGEDHLKIVCHLPDGSVKRHRLDAEPEVNYGLYPLGKHLLVVSGVNAGPSGAGTVFNIRTGQTVELEIYTAMYSEGEPEAMSMSLYSMSLIELQPGIYALAGTGNDAMLRVDGNV